MKRHLEGWQLGVVAVGIAFAAAVLGVPRAVAPRELPVPAVDCVEESAEEGADRRRADEALRHPLPFLVRATGEAFRRFGLAEARGDGDEAAALRAAYVARFNEARRRYGDTPLLALRAAQAELFVAATARFVASKSAESERELDELGGGFIRTASANLWFADGRVTLEPGELATLFRIRWVRLAGALETFPFSPSLNDWRIYYRTLLLHPEVPKAEAPETIQPEILTAYVNGLAGRDPDYPAFLARGILAHWMGHYGTAEELFVAHLREHPSGSWRLRAQNYLLAARRQEPSPNSVRHASF